MSHPEIIDIARRRAQVMGSLRKFFAERSFLEVDTPVLLTGPAPEAHIALSLPAAALLHLHTRATYNPHADDPLVPASRLADALAFNAAV